MAARISGRSMIIHAPSTACATHDIAFAGHRFVALADRALFWPSRGALLVADLHFEKASWFAAGGQMLPPFDSVATLTRLTALVEATGARELWALGDSFHDSAGPGRLPSTARALLGTLARMTRIIWIAGNHDARAELPGERVEEALIDGIMLRHEAQRGESAPEISGHFHPKLRVTTALRSIARPCIAAGDRRIIMPAFGALTGGLDALDPAILGLLGDRPCAMIATPQRLLRFDLSARAAPAARRRAGG